MVLRAKVRLHVGKTPSAPYDSSLDRLMASKWFAFPNVTADKEAYYHSMLCHRILPPDCRMRPLLHLFLCYAAILAEPVPGEEL